MSNRPQFAITQSDAVNLIRELPSNSVDMIFTDPPYESLEKHRAIGTTTRLKESKSSSNKWFSIFPNSRFDEFFGEAYRVLKKNTHLYLMCDAETMFVAKPAGEKAGFKFWKPIIWDKMKIGMGYHYRARYEVILFFEKGKRKLNDLSIPDVLAVPRIHGGYPTEKPVSLAQTFVAQSSQIGELVLDCFMGTASTGSAALQLGREFVGGDTNPEALEIGRSRLERIGTEASFDKFAINRQRDLGLQTGT